MVSTKKRLEQIENALIALAGGSAGFAAGRLGTGPAAKAAVRSPVGQAALAGFTIAQLREELNARDTMVAEQEFGPVAGTLTEIAQRVQPLPIPFGQVAVTGLDIGKKGRKKVKTKFNKAVSAGMKAVKASKFGGKPGKINNAKKVFGTVNKVASAVNKGKKVATKGIRGVAARAIKRIL